MFSLNLKFFLFSLIFLIGVSLIYKGYNSLHIIIKKNQIINLNLTINKKIKDDNFDKNINIKQKKPISQNIKNKKNIVKKNYKEIKIIVKNNDTFSKLITPFFNNKKKNIIINKLQTFYNLKNLKINQEIFFYKDDNSKIRKIKIPVSFEKDINIEINDKNISLIEIKHNIIKEINSLEFIISKSLYEDGVNAGIPLNILSEAIRLYSFDIDFQRDIKKNTKFEVSYEILINNQRENIKYGKIKYINLVLSNKNLEYFNFKTLDGYYDYFNREGKNVKKSILKTPIDGARLSSNFGMRKHPISGFNKLHKGIDFAAPKGTPIYAGGNGVIEYAGRNGGYGKYIRIRHNNNYKTAYAHLSSFKKGIQKGKRVNQGDVIGYVGNTGNSTGPHLHYEIIYKNKQINPMKLKLPSGKVLEGKELNIFRENIKNIYAEHLYALYE